ncbi:MAG: sigma-70 family RNA polymerase sigma factor [Ruminococcaceae bacterium]|nr:sigma-70 family RNA polymerase sigma factor [Oscillospiraceae bacterium]
MDDSKIIELFWERSERALEELSGKYGGYCRTIAWNILGSHQDTEECLNDTWLAAWDSIPPQKPRRLSVYMGRITRNLALNRRKSMTAQKRGGGQTEAVLEELRECLSGGTMDEQLDELVLRDAINTFLRGQRSRNRAIFLRRYWAMERVEDIAMDLGLGRGQTANILYRMRRELKKHLEKEGITL